MPYIKKKVSFVFLPNIFSKLNNYGKIIEKQESIKYISTGSCFTVMTTNASFIYTIIIQDALLIDPEMLYFYYLVLTLTIN